MDPPVITTDRDKFGLLICEVEAYLAAQTLYFAWYLDNNYMPGETNQTLVAMKKGYYSCTVSSAFDEASSSEFKFRKLMIVK